MQKVFTRRLKSVHAVNAFWLIFAEITHLANWQNLLQ
jgi:hypothetical protein